ncbi:MAG: hypothetical protein SFW64_07970 [Alphaproteobacteria bacterium]|nr:hypothetical protein [Alphaproteobacteria bacterium]
MSDDAGADKKEKKKGTLSTAGGRGKMRGKNKLLLILFSLMMMGLLRTGFVFFVIGMLPCIVAYYMDVSKHQYTFKSVFAANLAGMMPFITRIIHAGPSSSLLQEIMGNSTSWIIIYGSALIGWLLVKACPVLAQILVTGVHQTQFSRYDRLQKKLESEWGDEVKQFSGDHHAEH